MNILKIKYSSIILTTAILLFITGCDGDALSKNDATISYINALDEQANFYVKKSSNSGSIYDCKHKAISLMRGENSDEIKHKWFGLEKSELAVENTNNRKEQINIKEVLKDDRNYWLIAWLDGSDHKLSLFKKSSSSRDNLYRVRVFANNKLDVYLDDSNNKLLTTEVGKVSNYFSVEKCTGLVVGDNNIDLCSGDFGRSYLAVVDDNGLITLVKEQK